MFSTFSCELLAAAISFEFLHKIRNLMHSALLT